MLLHNVIWLICNKHLMETCTLRTKQLLSVPSEKLKDIIHEARTALKDQRLDLELVEKLNFPVSDGKRISVKELIVFYGEKNSALANIFS